MIVIAVIIGAAGWYAFAADGAPLWVALASTALMVSIYLGVLAHLFPRP